MARVRKDIKTVQRVTETTATPPSPVVIAKEITQEQSKKMVKDLLVDGWPTRRRVMFIVLGFCMLNVQYLLFWGQDTSLNKEIATTLLWVMAAIVGTYVFGAVWDDMSKRSTMVEYDTSYPTPVQRESA